MIGKTVAEFVRPLGVVSTDTRRIEGFAVDSRKVERGFVFFALQGQRVDGHHFVKEAFDRGAVAAVVSSHEMQYPPGGVCICVPDVLAFLHRLAKDVLLSLQLPVVAITGSMGKTTTKEFTCALLEEKYKVFKTPGNANSQVGVPLALLNQKTWDVDIIVLEMGMTQHGHIAKLMDIAQADVAVITKIAPAHIEYFPDGLEGIARAKAEILRGIKLKLAIVPSEAMRYGAIAEAATMLCHFFGFKGLLLKEEEGRLFIEQKSQRLAEVFLDQVPIHLRENFLAAALVARYFSLSWQQIGEGSKRLVSCERRFQKIERGGVTYVSDCYNANPASMAAALASIAQLAPGGRKIAALGPMVELGQGAEQYHKEIGSIARGCVDVLFCLDPRSLPMKEEFEKEGKRAFYFTELAEMKKELLCFVSQGDCVLIKASNAIGLWKLLEDP